MSRGGLPCRADFFGGHASVVEETLQGDNSDESEADAVLESRPLGLEVAPVTGDIGAIVESVSGSAAAQGIEPGSTLLRVNEVDVENLPTVQIQGCLDDEELPILLGLRLPPKARKARSQDCVTVCTQNCRGSYRVVSEAVRRLGWQEITGATRDASVMWLEHADPTDGLSPVQTMSRIEAFLCYCRKARLATSLNRWVKELPDEFAFSPKTWVLPGDAVELEAAMSRSKETFIAKPTAGSQGKGIVLARKWKDFEPIASKAKAAAELAQRNQTPLEYVVQRYISQPLLLDSLKFDLRLYVVSPTR